MPYSQHLSMDNLEELKLAYQLTKSPVTAWELHEQHQKTQNDIIKYLIAELKDRPEDTLILTYHGPFFASSEDYVNFLLNLVKKKRQQEHKDPLSIEY